MVFIIAVACFSGAVTIIFDVVRQNSNPINNALEDSYYQSDSYINDSLVVIDNLRKITRDYKSEEFILSGSTVTPDEINSQAESLYEEFTLNSKRYNPNLNEEENQVIFNQEYADKIAQIKNRLMQEDMRDYKSCLHRLEQSSGVLYYVKAEETEFTNSPGQTKAYYKTFPSYIILEGFEQELYPQEIMDSNHFSWLNNDPEQIDQQDAMYIAFTDEFLNPRIEKWQDEKDFVTNKMDQMVGFTLGFIIAFIYLLWVIGRRPEQDDQVHFYPIDRIYNDINLCLCGLLMASEVGALGFLYQMKRYDFFFLVTFMIAALGLMLVLALVKHLKNKTFISHSLTYLIFSKLFAFIKDIYNTGTTAVKVVSIVIAYPLIAGLTFIFGLRFILFPLTIGLACWIALKKVKEYNVITAGVKRVKDGDINHIIDIPGDGEFARLAADINHITDGLSQAVANEVKSERLKSELITNVSHDIRTPLTAIITYVDLLKQETDHDKTQEYIEIIDQKAQRLKGLTDDLFEASKASSGNMPVNYETIDIVSLITQGLGELDDKIQERRLAFKISHPRDKIFIKADGKLLWRAVENMLSNIFKYALEGSRVYIDIEDWQGEVKLTIKNISATELNVSADELMERFKRGDDARSTQGSGLGLSIAKSLIEIQGGSFQIEIDGDLFKVTMQMPSGE